MGHGESVQTRITGAAAGDRSRARRARRSATTAVVREHTRLDRAHGRLDEPVPVEGGVSVLAPPAQAFDFDFAEAEANMVPASVDLTLEFDQVRWDGSCAHRGSELTPSLPKR